MNTLESKLRIAHQIQVAAIKKGMSFNITARKDSFTMFVHYDNEIVESLFHWDVTEQELLDWWEEIEK
jgi:hypothetical protein